MKKSLRTLTKYEFTTLKKMGLLWELYPEAPEHYKDIYKALLSFGDILNIIGKWHKEMKKQKTSDPYVTLAFMIEEKMNAKIYLQKEENESKTLLREDEESK